MMTNVSRAVLYTGITNNLERRVSEHRMKTAKGYTQKYQATKLVYYEAYDDPRDAIAREKEIKGWRRSKKDDLVSQMNPAWDDLALALFPHWKEGKGV